MAMVNQTWRSPTAAGLFRSIATCAPGNISFGSRVDLPAQSGSLNVVLGDLDGDGKPELLTSAYLPQTMSVYRSLATSGSLTTNSFAAPVDYALAGRGHTIALGDLNGDGKPDVAEVTELSDALSIFQNVCTGNFTNTSLAAHVDFGTGWNAWGVAVGDLDGDGRPDAVLGTVYDNTLTFYRNITPFGVIPPVCTPAPSGMVAWWQAENNLADSAGSSLGTLKNGANFSAGEVGTAFNFDGVDDYLVVKGPNLNVGTGAGLSVEGWINPANTTTPMPIIFYENNLGTYNGYDAGMHFYISIYPDTGTGPGCLVANLLDTNSVSHIIASTTNLVTAGVWQHVALTYDRSSGNAAIYLNGTPVVQTNLGSFTVQTTFTNLLIGGHTTYGSEANPSEKFAGKMDELSLYSRALSGSEISALYNASSAGKCYTPSAPLIVTQPNSVTVTVNGTASFNVTAQGTAPLFYQWRCNGTNLTGANGASLILSNVPPAFAGNYSVVVSNFVGTATSSNATLTVYVPPTPPILLAQTASQIVLLGNTPIFSVTVGGSDPLNYFWFRNNLPISGATKSFYALGNAQLADSGSQFSCLVTNLYGTVSSTNVTLKVLNTLPNDLCSGAIMITNASYTNMQSTVRASSFGDPVPDCVTGFGNGVWYQFTAPVSGLLVVDTAGSDFDTGLAVYAGACEALTQLACDDDAAGPTSQITLPTIAGTT
jgi:hypothetical protein